MAEVKPSSSSATEPKVKELFDMTNFPHWLDSDEEDYDDFSEKDKDKNPEYFLTDKEVEAAFQEMTEEEKKMFLEYKAFHEAEYRQFGEIWPLSDYVQAIMKYHKPGIPTQSTEMQERLRSKLLQKARTKDELRERGDLPEKKPKVKRIRTTFLGPSTEREEKEDGTVVVKLLPSKDPYEDLFHEEDELVDLTGLDSASEVNPDEESGDDLSIVTLDSLSNINKDKVKELWSEMAETKAKEADIYSKLASMVEDMPPAVIQETVAQTPRPGSTIPGCIETFYHELGNASLFKRIVATGFLMYEQYMENKDPKYKKTSLRGILKKFETDSKGLCELLRGEAYGREKKKLERMIKEEMKAEMKPEVDTEVQPSTSRIEVPGIPEGFEVPADVYEEASSSERTDTASEGSNTTEPPAKQPKLQ